MKVTSSLAALFFVNLTAGACIPRNLGNTTASTPQQCSAHILIDQICAGTDEMVRIRFDQGIKGADSSPLSIPNLDPSSPHVLWQDSPLTPITNHSTWLSYTLPGDKKFRVRWVPDVKGTDGKLGFTYEACAWASPADVRNETDKACEGMAYCNRFAWSV